MKKIALALALFVAAAATVPGVADARRIGGGGAVGMQRSMPTRTPDAVPVKPAAPVAQPAAPATAGATPAAAPRRSWMGPIAGLAAGLGIDAPAFERVAKMIFIRMQAANDSADLNDLRAFTTPEMFAVIKLDLQERGGKVQRTDVVRVDAEVLDVASEAERQIVSVRFHGLIREEDNGVAEPFDEVWHLVKPADGSREWAIAGIQ